MSCDDYCCNHHSTPSPHQRAFLHPHQWDGRVSFTLTDDLKLKKISFSDGVLEQSKTQCQRADDFDGNVLMSTSEIGQMLDELIAELDGAEK